MLYFTETSINLHPKAKNHTVQNNQKLQKQERDDDQIITFLFLYQERTNESELIKSDISSNSVYSMCLI